MRIPFINSDKCKHEEWQLEPTRAESYHAQWHGEHVTLRRTQTYYEQCTECGERLSSISKRADGNVGSELLESVTIPAEVVDQYRDEEADREQ